MRWNGYREIGGIRSGKGIWRGSGKGPDGVKVGERRAEYVRASQRREQVRGMHRKKPEKGRREERSMKNCWPRQGSSPQALERGIRQLA